jgi:hypothetical protein
MGNTTIGGIVIHDGSSSVIKDNDCRKESSLAVMPLYLSDSDDTDVFDFGGVVKTITFSGTYVAENVAALKTWVDALEALQNGHQDTDTGYPLTLVDDLRGTLKVKILYFNSTQVEAEPTKINWSLKVVQSSTNA